MPKTHCPECDAEINISNPRDGAQTRCPECGVELEIISSDPFDVDYVYDDDWGDDDDWDD